jgi:hypothetical protein
VAARLQAIHDKSDANEMRLDPKRNIEKMYICIADMIDGRKEQTACQEDRETNPEKMDLNSGEQAAVVERQEIPNEEVAVHSMRACRSQRTACQEATEANPEKMEPIDRAIAVLEQMIAITKANGEKTKATDLKANPDEEMES